MVTHIAHQLFNRRWKPIFVLVGDIVVDYRHIEETTDILLVVGVLDKNRLVASDVQVSNIE